MAPAKLVKSPATTPLRTGVLEPLGVFSRKAGFSISRLIASEYYCAMRPRAKLVRVGLSIIYFIISFGTLFFCTGDSPGWLQANGQSRVMTIARLALACTVWDVFARACGSVAAAAIKMPEIKLATAPLASALFAGLGLASIPWIYRGSGRFMLESIGVDASPFFVVGYGMAFPLVVAPLLALATLLSEWLNLAVE
jgi:hypothetical protein